MRQPYYMVDFSVAHCMFEIRINDISVMTLDIPGQVASMTPVNFSILESGVQTISATLLPHSGQLSLDPAAMLKFNIKLYDVDKDFVFKEQLAAYQFAPVKEEQKIPVLRHQLTFNATVPYQLKGWQEGTNLKDVEDMNEKLRTAYQNIATLINNKRYDRFKEVITNREHIMVTSMYMSPQQANARIDGLIEDFEAGFKVAPVPANAVLQTYGNGKMAALKKINGESALYLVNEETKEELMLDMMFYIPKGKTAFEII